MTTTLERPPTTSEPPPERRTVRMPGVRWQLLAVFVVWLLGWALWRGRATLELPGADLTNFQLWLNSVRDAFDAARADSFFFEYIIGGISTVIDTTVEWLRELISQPAFPRPVPEIGWFGVIALFTWVAFALAGVRSAVLVLAGLLAFGFLGYWGDSLDTLIVTSVAVFVCVIIGIPLGIWMARSTRANAAITPVLDVMQTMPSFAYLAPLVLVFGIGPASAVVVTLIYSLPPLARITAHGIRSVSPTTIEAVRSMGVQPHADPAQGAAADGAADHHRGSQPVHDGRAVDGDHRRADQRSRVGPAGGAGAAEPGHRQRVRERHRDRDHGDRAGPDHHRGRGAQRGGGPDRQGRRPEAADRTDRRGRGRRSSRSTCPGCGCSWPSSPTSQTWAAPLAAGVSAFTDWFVSAVSGFTGAITNLVSNLLLNPLQSMLADSPWWLIALVLLAVSYILGGWRRR